MNKDELRKVAQVLRNKIYNENIKFYEQLAYEGKEYAGHVLTENITILDIEKALTYKEDLNKINDLDMQQYIHIDLNAFLNRVVMIREYTIQSYAEFIKTNPIDLSIFWLEPIMECFTEEECRVIKKIFLKKGVNWDIDAMDENGINNLFFSLYNEIKLELEEKTCEKSL